MNPTRHLGSCHCGAVRFEAVLDASHGSRCNCTICNKLGITTTLVKPDAFTLVAGEAALTKYEWGGKTAQRYFCATCGVTCFSRGYLEEVGGAYVSVSLNAVDDVDLIDVALTHWDGRHNNWQAGRRPTPWPIQAG
jgi:hypothetical protein